MFFLGNDFPNYADSSGSVERRIFLIDYARKVHDSDPMLFANMTQNIDMFLRKAIVLYLKEVRDNANKELWTASPPIVPVQIMKFRDEMTAEISPLRDFVVNHCKTPQQHPDGSVEELAVPLSEFKDAYAQYRASERLPTQAFKKNHYLKIFQDFGIYFEIRSAVWRGEPRQERFVVGVDLCSDEVHDGLV
jgi:phage/plasmid-associated DNA primase